MQPAASRPPPAQRHGEAAAWLGRERKIAPPDDRGLIEKLHVLG